MTETQQHTQCSNLFGLLIGEWDFLWHNFAQGKIAHKVKGEWLFSRLPQYHGIYDVFICPSRQETEKSGICVRPRTSKRLYNPKTNEWNTYDGDDDNFNRLRTQCTEDQIIIWDDTPQDFRLRWTIKDIELHSFYWCCEATHDGGQTWTLVEELHATRKPKNATTPLA